ncbi:unnamed protein product [Boreogadus saida]
MRFYSQKKAATLACVQHTFLCIDGGAWEGSSATQNPWFTCSPRGISTIQGHESLNTGHRNRGLVLWQSAPAPHMFHVNTSRFLQYGSRPRPRMWSLCHWLRPTAGETDSSAECRAQACVFAATYLMQTLHSLDLGRAEPFPGKVPLIVSLISWPIN